MIKIEIDKAENFIPEIEVLTVDDLNEWLDEAIESLEASNVPQSAIFGAKGLANKLREAIKIPTNPEEG